MRDKRASARAWQSAVLNIEPSNQVVFLLPRAPCSAHATQMAPSAATVNALGAVGGILLGACQVPQLIKLYRCGGCAAAGSAQCATKSRRRAVSRARRRTRCRAPSSRTLRPVLRSRHLLTRAAFSTLLLQHCVQDKERPRLVLPLPCRLQRGPAVHSALFVVRVGDCGLCVRVRGAR